jgi:uncharacterized SAM-binding protein YcdF (DUF218 family)
LGAGERTLIRADPRRGRLFRRFLTSTCAFLVVAMIAGLPVYVRPQIDPLRHADAIFILGGPTYDRYPFGMDLGQQGWAPMVVVSNPNGAKDPWLSKMCAKPPDGLNLQCFNPHPGTTKGEAQELRRLATKYGWRTVIVVTFRPHISRARYILAQCFTGNLIMIASPSHISPARWAYQYVYQTAGYAWAAFDRDC